MTPTIYCRLERFLLCKLDGDLRTRHRAENVNCPHHSNVYIEKTTPCCMLSVYFSFFNHFSHWLTYNTEIHSTIALYEKKTQFMRISFEAVIFSISINWGNNDKIIASCYDYWNGDGRDKYKWKNIIFKVLLVWKIHKIYKWESKRNRSVENKLDENVEMLANRQNGKTENTE